jgi:hypothetical protein
MLLILAETEDTLLTGFSGLIILALVVWLIVRALNKRG